MRRQCLGLSLRQLVGRAGGVAESTVTGALYGYHEGSVRTWWAIARALDMPVGELMAHLDDSLTEAGPNASGLELPPP
jgi:transcriptional regulator with XRE-family HTH domain